MKEFIKLFKTPENGSGYVIRHIPFLSAVKSTKQRINCNVRNMGLKKVEDILVLGETPSNAVQFTALKNNSSIGLVSLSTNQTLEYTVDLGVTWLPMTTEVNIDLEHNGDAVFVRGILNDNNTAINYTQFKMTGKIAASGNCNYLWNYQNPNVSLKEYCGYRMFEGCTSLVSAPELPATTLSYCCYYYMFYDCTNLTTAPELPATTLNEWCYSGMFEGCTSLTVAPELSATSLADYCYCDMFNGCVSLVTAPTILPATTLANYCYQSMFQGCTLLATTPELPATTLSPSCYISMFAGCASLTTSPELPATTLASKCYGGMFKNCISLTKAPVLQAVTLAFGCYRSMFENCTSLTTSPVLIATTLANSCYHNMFQGCSSLNHVTCLSTGDNSYYTNWLKDVSNEGVFIKNQEINNWTAGVNGIPEGWDIYDYKPVKFTAEQNNSTIGLVELPNNQILEYSANGIEWINVTKTTVITLTNSGDAVFVRGILNDNNTAINYTQFKMTGKISASGNCNYLWNYENPGAPLKKYCGYYMFKGCTSLTKAPELPAMELTYDCYGSMFENCTSLTQAPELPATTLNEWCYSFMFSGCTSLTSVPELPATTLFKGCYARLFENCTSLTSVPSDLLPAITLADSCYSHMFYHCTSLTTAPELPANILVKSCYTHMFHECTHLNYIKCLATNKSAAYCTNQWVKSVASSGRFVKHPNMSNWTRGESEVPAGWALVNA